MRKYTEFVLLAGVLLISSWTLVLAPFTSIAFAATNKQTISHLAASKLTSSQTSAGVTCSTQQHEKDEHDPISIVFWLRMKTTWCYNFITVTSHSTILYWGTTGYGSVSGWRYIGNPQYSFNCYVAAGAPTGGGCSGNHEHADELWINGPSQCHLVVDEEENYKGQFFWQDSQYGDCPQP